MLDQSAGTGQNRKMKPFLAAMALCLFCSVGTAEARLGETIAQCEARYGPVVEKRPALLKESDPEACMFSKSGITALVEFKRGIAWRILFRMIGMTTKEAETLLKANMAEGGWGPALKINGQDFRISSDRQRIAVFTPAIEKSDVPTLEIATRDYGQANHAAYSAMTAEAVDQVKDKKARQDLKGF